MSSASKVKRRMRVEEGGLSRSSHGYILIKVRPGHHLAHAHGFAYEHRFIAEKMLGRRLRRAEHVHHKNGNKTDNHPSNLEVLSAHEHRRRHSHSSRSRAPGERNPLVLCACDCGIKFRKYDSSGRPRRYKSGHNELPHPRQDKILRILLGGPLHIREASRETGINPEGITCVLSNLKQKDLARRISRGVWVCKNRRRAGSLIGISRKSAHLTPKKPGGILGEMAWELTQNLGKGRLHSSILFALRKAYRLGLRARLDGDNRA